MDRRARRSIALVIGTLMLGALLVAPAVGNAQTQIKPRIMIIFDSSGSMAWTFSSASTYGDGSTDPWTGGRQCCPGNGGSRLYSAKEALRQMVLSSGDIEFGLLKFAQDYTTTGGWSANQYYYNQTASAADIIRYNGITSFADYRSHLCVGFGEQTGTLPNQRDVTLENDPADHGTRFALASSKMDAVSLE